MTVFLHQPGVLHVCRAMLVDAAVVFLVELVLIQGTASDISGVNR